MRFFVASLVLLTLILIERVVSVNNSQQSPADITYVDGKAPVHLVAGPARNGQRGVVVSHYNQGPTYTHSSNQQGSVITTSQQLNSQGEGASVGQQYFSRYSQTPSVGHQYAAHQTEQGHTGQYQAQSHHLVDGYGGTSVGGYVIHSSPATVQHYDQPIGVTYSPAVNTQTVISQPTSFPVVQKTLHVQPTYQTTYYQQEPTYRTVTPVPQVPVVQHVPAVYDVPVSQVHEHHGVVHKTVNVAQPVIKTRKYEVRRPAIQKQFYDIEERIIVRPAGSVVVELDQPVSKTQTGETVVAVNSGKSGVQYISSGTHGHQTLESSTVHPGYIEETSSGSGSGTSSISSFLPATGNGGVLYANTHQEVHPSQHLSAQLTTGPATFPTPASISIQDGDTVIVEAKNGDQDRLQENSVVGQANVTQNSPQQYGKGYSQQQFASSTEATQGFISSSTAGYRSAPVQHQTQVLFRKGQVQAEYSPDPAIEQNQQQQLRYQVQETTHHQPQQLHYPVHVNAPYQQQQFHYQIQGATHHQPQQLHYEVQVNAPHQQQQTHYQAQVINHHQPQQLHYQVQENTQHQPLQLHYQVQQNAQHQPQQLHYQVQQNTQHQPKQLHYHIPENNLQEQQHLRYKVQDSTHHQQQQQLHYSVQENTRHQQQVQVPFMITVGEPDFKRAPYVDIRPNGAPPPANLHVGQQQEHHYTISTETPISGRHLQSSLNQHVEQGSNQQQFAQASLLQTTASTHLSDSQSSLNQKQFIDLLLARGKVSETGFGGTSGVGVEGVQHYGATGSNGGIVRSRVISATAAPNRPDQTGERVHTRRIVVSHPIETIQEIEEQEPVTNYHQVVVKQPTVFRTNSIGVKRVQTQVPVYVNNVTPTIASDPIAATTSVPIAVHQHYPTISTVSIATTPVTTVQGHYHPTGVGHPISVSYKKK